MDHACGPTKGQHGLAAIRQRQIHREQAELLVDHLGDLHALGFVGLSVNRLLRISFGDFKLGTLKKGEVQEVRLSRVKNLLKDRVDNSQAEKSQKKYSGTKSLNDNSNISGKRNVNRSERRNK